MKKYIVLFILILVFFIAFSLNGVCENLSVDYILSIDVIKPNVILNYGDTIIIGTDKGYGIAKFNKSTEQFEWCLPRSGQLPPEEPISSIEVDASGNIWFGYYSSGIGYFDGEDYVFYNSDNSPLPYSLCYDIEIDKNNCIYVNIWCWLTIIKKEIWETFDLRDFPMDVPYLIEDIETDASGILWLGGSYLGVSIPGDYWSLAKFTDNQLIPVTGDYHIASLLFDEDGILWLGTWMSGLVKYDGSEFYSYNPDNSNIICEYVGDLRLDSHGNIWFRDYLDNLVCFDRSNFTTYHLPDYHPENIDHISSIYSLAVDENDIVWMGIRGWSKNQWGTYFFKRGLLRFDGNTWKFYQLPEPPPVHVEEEKQGEFRLWQNYPNPFNPVATIKYSIASPSHVKLDVYSITGQKVATLVDGTMSAGEHSVKFDGSNLSSGIYLYRFTSKGFEKTGRMILVK